MAFLAARGIYHFKLSTIWPLLFSHQLASPGHAAYDCYRGEFDALILWDNIIYMFPNNLSPLAFLKFEYMECFIIKICWDKPKVKAEPVLPSN